MLFEHAQVVYGVPLIVSVRATVLFNERDTKQSQVNFFLSFPLKRAAHLQCQSSCLPDRPGHQTQLAAGQQTCRHCVLLL